MIFYQTMPPLTDDEYRELKASIERNGVQVPVIIDEEGNVIDGHHRVMIANELGIKYPKHMVMDLTEDQKLDLSVSLNVDRRQLTRDQKRQVIAAQVKRHPEKSNREHAGQLGVDHKTVAAIRTALEGTGEIPQLDRTVGADGKERPSTRPTPVRTEYVDVTTGEIIDDPQEIPSAVVMEPQGYSVSEEPTTPRTVTGLDGKTYSVPEQPTQQEPRTHRTPITKQMFNAFVEASEAARTLEDLTEDPRFAKNRKEVAAKNRNDLIQTIDALHRVMEALDETVE